MTITKEQIDNLMDKIASQSQDMKEVKKGQLAISQSNFYHEQFKICLKLLETNPILTVHGTIITSFRAGLAIGYELGQTKVLEEMFKEEN